MCADQYTSIRADIVKERLNLLSVTDIYPVTDIILGVGVLNVQKVNVNAIIVIGGIDQGNSVQGFLNFVLKGAGYGAGIINDKDGVKGAKEGVRVFKCGKANY